MSQPGIDYSSPINFNIPQKSPENVPPQLRPIVDDIYTALQNIIKILVDNAGLGSQLPAQWAQLAGIPGSTYKAANLGRLYVTAFEAIQQGAMVNFFLDAGILKARNANATTSVKMCNGFCSTPGGLAPGISGEFISGLGTVAISGLTIGTRYYLSTVNGLITAVAPVAAGNIEQFVGIALQPSLLLFNCGYYIPH
jgi:hypothetical protein